MGWRREPAHSRGTAHRRCAVVYPKKGRCLCLAAVVSFVPLAVMVVPALCLVLGPQDASTALLPGSCQLDEERASSCPVWGIGPWGAATKGFMGGSHGEKRVAESQLRLSHNKEQNTGESAHAPGSKPEREMPAANGTGWMKGPLQGVGPLLTRWGKRPGGDPQCDQILGAARWPCCKPSPRKWWDASGVSNFSLRKVKIVTMKVWLAWGVKQQCY